MKMLKMLLERLIPLPEPEKRCGGFPPYRWLHPGLRIERDADYLCYLLFKTGFYVGMCFFVFVLIDMHFKAGIFIDMEAFQQDKLLFSLALTKIMAVVMAILTPVFYLRTRLFMDIKNDGIPFLIRRIMLRGKPKKKWVRLGVWILFVSIAIISGSYILIAQVTGHYNMQDSLPLILILAMSFTIYGGAYSGALALASMQFLEKTIRFFPEAQADLEKMGKDRYGQ